jgi:hypothetical protein
VGRDTYPCIDPPFESWGEAHLWAANYAAKMEALGWRCVRRPDFYVCIDGHRHVVIHLIPPTLGRW